MTKKISHIKEKLFLDLKAPIYQNKKNGQISITLSRKQLKNFIDVKPDHEMTIPKTIPIRIFKWRSR